MQIAAVFVVDHSRSNRPSGVAQMLMSVKSPVLAGLICLAPVSGSAQSAGVDLALILAVDVSSSMSMDELAVQRAGYVAAISDPRIAEAITNGALHRIALSYVEWADPGLQVVTMPWQIIDGSAAATIFAAELAQKPLVSGTNTSISAALRFSARLFHNLDVPADRYVIDISGDGPNSAGAHVAPVRDRLVADWIVINGVPILIDPAPLDAATGMTLADYYRDCVVGGAGAFVVPAASVDGIVDAIRRKLVLEIADLPPRAAVVPVAGTVQADCTFGQKDFYE
jgi:hypothetical protein